MIFDNNYNNTTHINNKGAKKNRRKVKFKLTLNLVVIGISLAIV
jgi:hypothetical protein